MKFVAKQKTWYILDVLQEATRYLSSQEIENARLNAEWLLAHVLDISRVDLYLQFDKPLEQMERETYKGLLRERANHKPLQYIMGETDFFSIPLKVDERVLIPRPETEILVEKTIHEIEHIFGSTEKVRCLDIGTGSGNIAIAVAKNLKNVFFTAIDISADAIDVAKSNADHTGVADRIDFEIINILTKEPLAQLREPYDVVVSNPPYVAADAYKSLPLDVREYEPEVALKAGSDGMQFYGCLADLMVRFLKKPGLAFFEIGETQAEAVRSFFLLKNFQKISIIKDYNHKDRIVFVSLV